MSIILFTSGSLLAHTIGTVSFVVNVDGARYQLSNSCLQSTVDASQGCTITFWGASWIKNYFYGMDKDNFVCNIDVEAHAYSYLGTCIYIIYIYIYIYTYIYIYIHTYRYRPL